MKKSFLSLSCAMAAGLIAVTSFAGCGAGSGGNSALNANKDYATKVIAKYNSDANSAQFEFSDEAFSKGNLAAMLFKPGMSAEDMQKIARNLFLKSFIITDEKGTAVACYPEGTVNGRVKDSQEYGSFHKVVKGVAEKLMDDPVLNDDGTYGIKAGVKRSDADGAVIVSYDSKDYADIAGDNLAEKCGANTFVIKDSKVLSSTLEGVEAGKSLEDIGLSTDDLSKDSFSFKVGDKTYTAVAAAKGDLTVVCAAA